MLRSPEFTAALAAAAEVVDRGPVAAATALRARGVAPDLAAAALTQATLRRQAVGKFGPAASSMYFSRTGLEQATRAVVARLRGERLARSGAACVADLGCGIGSDSLAFARAGLRVRAVDADPFTVEVARANTSGLDVTVSLGDAAAFDLSAVDAVFCDPARRTASGRRAFSTAGWSPPWEFVSGLADRVPRTVLKLAPGLDHALIPPGAEAQWVSVGGDLVEAAVWAPALAAVPRRATVIDASERVVELTGPGTRTAPVGPVRRFLLDPDGAVTRSGLVAELFEPLGANLADPTIAFGYADAPAHTPFTRCLEVIDELPVAVKRMRAAVRARGIGRLEIRKRGSALDVERLRRELRLSGAGSATLVLTRVAGAPAALLCSPWQDREPPRPHC